MSRAEAKAGQELRGEKLQGQNPQGGRLPPSGWRGEALRSPAAPWLVGSLCILSALWAQHGVEADRQTASGRSVEKAAQGGGVST